MSASTNSIKQEPNIKEEYDSCYDASTDDDEEPNSISADAVLKSEEDQKQDDACLQEANSCSVFNSSAGDCKESDGDEDSIDPVLFDHYNAPEAYVAFCCQKCTCGEAKVGKNIRNNCGNTGNIMLYHRGCCHNDAKTFDDYLSPMQRAINNIADGEGKKKGGKKPKRPKLCSGLLSRDVILKQYNNAMREEAKFENQEYDVDKTSQVLTNESYVKSIAKFQAQLDNERCNGLRVLALFSGIGSETVALKRLGLPIDVIVHVEHDPVAVEVIKWNHHNDGITHIFVEKFEHIYGEDNNPNDGLVEEFISKHGPFDFVTSGAPCQNLSGINAYRDITSESAVYLKKAGKLIIRLNHIQTSVNGIQNEILFLSENVVFKESEDFNGHYSDHLHGLSPMRVDAKDFGPVKRDRLYWLNLPVNSAEPIKNVASAVSADTCLDDGWKSVARLLPSANENMVYKANTFLASTSRIDDDRMRAKFRVDSEAKYNGSYDVQSYSVSERERMMGLPVGYVEEPLRHLFTELAKNAFVLPESNEGKTYRDYLPRSLWHFRKRCKFQFHPSSEYPFFQLHLSSPLEGKKLLTYFSQEQYCKHLIGNGWSIPVVEHLLGKLPEIFDASCMKQYEGYEYVFPWEPYKSQK